MKKIVFAFASVMMLMACNKAAVVDNTGKDDSQPQPQPEAATVVTLKAVMPGFASDTKATIADDGTFSWAEGDKIAVRYTKADAADEYVEFTCTDAANCEFEGTPSAGYSIATSGNIAFYPSDYRGTPSSYSGSAAEAAKSFQMKATSFVDGKLSFQHDNALLKVTINNIPSVADNIVIGNNTMGSTVTITEGGNLTVMVPSIPSVADNLHIYVKKGDTVLYTKGTSKGVAINAGYLYTRIPTLTVAPEAVYLKSNMTDWATEGDVAGWDAMALNDGVYEASLNSLGNQFATVYVKWNGNLIKMGPEEDQSTTESQVFVEGSHAVKLSTLGTYTFTFDSITSTFEFTKTSDTFDFYVFGSENSWNLTDTSLPLDSKTADGKYYLIGQKGEYKIRYNTFEASSFGYGSSDSGSTGVNVFGPGTTGSSSVIINIPTDGSGVTYNYFNESYAASAKDGVNKVQIVDYVDGTNNAYMEQDSYNANLWVLTKKFTANISTGTRIVFRFNDNGSWNWGTDSSTSNVEYGSMGHSDGDTFWVQSDKYLVVLNCQTGKIKFLRLPTETSGESMILDGTEYDI